jgi:hypothetical protein
VLWLLRFQLLTGAPASCGSAAVWHAAAADMPVCTDRQQPHHNMGEQAEGQEVVVCGERNSLAALASLGSITSAEQNFVYQAFHSTSLLCPVDAGRWDTRALLLSVASAASEC